MTREGRDRVSAATRLSRRVVRFGLIWSLRRDRYVFRASEVHVPGHLARFEHEVCVDLCRGRCGDAPALAFADYRHV